MDCYGNHEESELVEICITNMLTEYRVHLENLDIIKFMVLLQKAGKTALSVKAQVEKPKRSGQQVLAVSTQPNTKRKRQEDKP